MKKLSILLIITTVLLNACIKETLSTTSLSSVDTEDAVAGATKLVLQPGPDDGQDAMVDYRSYDHSADSNRNSNPELTAYAWTVNGNPIKARSYIKFSGLSALPANKKVVAAKLFLYGVDTSSWTPQGNSVYKNSPFLIYSTHNDCYVQRVISGDWDQEMITWNNAPAATIADEAVIPRSTSKWNYNAAIDVTTMVAKMVSEQKNYGFKIMLMEESVYRSIIFATSESIDAAKRPKLVVYYK